ncbi:MAG: ABC transporter permease subunit [Olsenella sp.]|nr:ABC transporter permease subunit [Olsenella sp.]
MNKILGFLKKYWLTFVILASMIALYWMVSEYGLINKMMFPKISSINSVFASDFHTMLLNLSASIKLIIPSLLVTIAIALSLGILLGMNKYCRKAFYPIIYIFSCVPSVLLSPLVSAMSSNLVVSSIILIVYDSVFTLIFSTITGIESIDKRYLDNAKTMQLRGPKLMFEVVLPAASPTILGGFINALRSSFTILVFAEMFGSSFGLGYYIRRYSSLGIFPNVWAGFIFMVVVLVLIMFFFEKIKNYMLRWTN